MKRILTTSILALAVALSAFAGPKATAGKGKTCFAVFTDAETYAKCSDAIMKYKKALDAEGLGTYVYAEDWKSPDEIKAVIAGLIGSKKQPLEGAVFVGDVPVVMVRGAQHLTTAFKMDEDRYPVFDSSVASDRFYDCPDLDFEYLDRDTVVSNTFYYRLTEKGSQTLKPVIYTARIKVPQFMVDSGADKYALISDFLEKAAAAHSEADVLDNITYFFGSGYNSEDMNVWRERSFAYGDVFPNAYRKASGNRWLNFHQSETMKYTLFSELQRGGVDFFQFSEHGAPETQYISRWDDRSTLDRNTFDLKAGLSDALDKAERGADGQPHFKYEAMDSIYRRFAPECFSDSMRREYHVTDSAYRRSKDIFQEEIAAIHTNARVVVLNACYNGSFHNPEGYVGGAHLFNGGRCIVVQGNTVNVLQDKYEDKLLGYLTLGLRAGMWQKEVPYLEGHMLGDPTFRFAPAPADKVLSGRLYDMLRFKSSDAATWERLLSSDNPTARAAAISHLASCADEEHVAETAQSMLETDPSCNVRMCAFSVLCGLDPKFFERAFAVASKDGYELIVRNAYKAADAYGSAGKDDFILKSAREFSESHPELVRVGYYTKSLENLVTGGGWLLECLYSAADTSMKDTKRINGIRYFRNNRYIPAIPVLLSIVSDDGSSDQVRTVAAECLGWYNSSAAKSAALSGLENALQGSLPEPVRAEVVKSIARLM